jgi:hypothetical protein
MAICTLDITCHKSITARPFICHNHLLQVSRRVITPVILCYKRLWHPPLSTGVLRLTYLLRYLRSIDIYDVKLTPYRVSYCCLSRTCFTNSLGDVLGSRSRFCILFRWRVPRFGKRAPQADLVDECNARCRST